MLETWTAILAFAPVVGWLGNPAWWRETLPRLAHYYMLSMDRQGTLPDIQILYFGQLYEFSLPWHNALVLMAITVPAAILGAGVIGLVWGLRRIRRDRLPLYFLIHFLTLPVIRMFPTPAHDGVRLFLPTFFFLAAFAGWGTVWLADLLTRVVRLPPRLARPALAGLVLGSAALTLVRIHPYELSYYNELIGGPRGAWERGLRADLLVRRVQRAGDRGPQPQASSRMPASTSSTTRPSPSPSRSCRPWGNFEEISSRQSRAPTSSRMSGS